MRATTLLRRLLGMKHTLVRGFEMTDEAMILDVAPTTLSPYCSGCGGRGRRYDHRERTWRHIDFGGWRVLLRYGIWRVECAKCGVKTELVPWAEPDSGFTRPFEQIVCFLAQRTDQTSVCRLMRVAWDTVGQIIRRVVRRLRTGDPLANVVNIGVDELSYRRHHEYVTIVNNQDTGAVIWAAPGRSADTLRLFFDALGQERASKLETVTIDMAQGYIEAVRDRAPQARIVFDRFHVQRLAHNALDEVRRALVREVREEGDRDGARAIKKTRFALQKNPWNLKPVESERLADVQRHNRPLYRAYLLKETLAAILDRRQQHVARAKLGEWIAWAQRSRLEPFRKVAGTIQRHLDGIVAYVDTKLSNGRAEGLNGKVRTITRRAYGFHSAHALIALIFLCCSGLVISAPHQPVPG